MNFTNHLFHMIMNICIYTDMYLSSIPVLLDKELSQCKVTSVYFEELIYRVCMVKAMKQAKTKK